MSFSQTILEVADSTSPGSQAGALLAQLTAACGGAGAGAAAAAQIVAGIETNEQSDIYSPTGSPNSDDLPFISAYAARVTGVSPSSGAAGTSLTISGLRFTKATAVLFSAQPGSDPGIPAASFTIVSDSEITAVTPNMLVDSVTYDVLIQTGPFVNVSQATPLDEFTASA